MSTTTVRAGDVRLPREAREALEQREPVTVTDRDRPAFVILHPDDYAYASPLLERRRQGLPIPVERLLTEDDFAIIREESLDAIDDGILESWVS